MSDARAYVESMGLSEAITAAVKQVIIERPANAVERIGELLIASVKTVTNPTIHVTLKVPAEKEAEMDDFWRIHEAFMRKTHTVGSAGNDSIGPRLQQFYISKGKELNNPLDPAEGETGNFIYQMSETYYTGAGIAKHMDLFMQHAPEAFKKLTGEYAPAYGVHLDIGLTAIFTCYADNGAIVQAPKGAPTIHVTLKVPADKETELDAFWKKHEAWMRNTHTVGALGDGVKGPRIYHFYIAKGKELSNPLDPASSETGAILYQMSESYVAPSDIAKHMELFMNDEPESFKTLTGVYAPTYGVHLDIGATAVYTNFND